MQAALEKAQADLGAALEAQPSQAAQSSQDVPALKEAIRNLCSNVCITLLTSLLYMQLSSPSFRHLHYVSASNGDST